jgi:MinD-like ATPase involved in chromosome partitioning or flagellar assembly
MYIVTFYSYKGGTGRSMALVNTAVDLVKSGLRVLIVDFDLEAPGIDTFKLPKSRKKTKGIVDFVLDYLATGQAPDLMSYVYKSPVPDIDGELWIMPAGKADDRYDQRFKSIDWHNLYEQNDGFVLFEDLKAQWNSLLRPDYVLIDSRTGHTDVSGICTRQLPDSVVLCFFPNEQNRRGLVTVVNQIRKESSSDRKKEINIHFVMSNVPELDDEEGFLASNVKYIKESLEFSEFSAVIHHYQSLALLNQSIFALERPRTRLAIEYQKLARAIRKPNLDDRESAIEYLEEAISSSRIRRLSAGVLENKIGNIQTKHNRDKDVLVKLAVLSRHQKNFDEALSLLEQAGKLGASGTEFYLMRAELYIIADKIEDALKDIGELLTHDDVTYLEILSVVRLLLSREPKKLSVVIQSKAFNNLDAAGKTYVLNEFLESRDALALAIPELLKIVDITELDNFAEKVNQANLIVSLIGNGQYAKAIEIITKQGSKSIKECTIEEAFNYGMATWGLTANIYIDAFQRVVELDEIEQVRSANGHLCLTIALWISDKKSDAKKRLTAAWQEILESSADFSPWSYLKLSRERFLKDLQEVERLINGEEIQPRFINENRSKKEV